MLAFLNFKKPLEMETDASGFAIGCVLSQGGDDDKSWTADNHREEL